MSLGSQRVRSCRQAAASTLGRGVKGAKGGAVSKKSAFQGGKCCLYRDGVCLSSWWEYGGATQETCGRVWEGILGKLNWGRKTYAGCRQHLGLSLGEKASWALNSLSSVCWFLPWCSLLPPPPWWTNISMNCALIQNKPFSPWPFFSSTRRELSRDH